MAGTKRITLVTDELLGYVRTGGIGTATTYLAVALGRMGHEVALLAVGEPPKARMADEWSRLYEQADVAVRVLPRSHRRIEPSYFRRMRDVEDALAADPPDVVITQDLAAPAYTALRLRHLGLGFEQTLFVVYCHGGRRWITDMARKVRVLPGAHAVTELERASVEIADVVVSPSAYLIDWMRNEGWRLPAQAIVIPHLSRSAATGEAQARATSNGGRVTRIAFFGRLEERKGLKPFAAGLNALPPELLHDVELEFVGGATPAWPPQRIEALLADRTRRALRRISFETDLDQPQAFARLSRPGTLAVMPSLGETFSNAVFECLERGIPFLASDAGAPAELVAPEDRDRVLFEPSADGVAAALRRALSNGDALRPARAAFDAATACERWAEVVEFQPEARPRGEPADSIVVSDETEVLDEDCVELLTQAQAASGADVVTCGVRLGDGSERLFLGEPRGLGLLANHYGTVGLVRRSVLPDGAERQDPWPLYAQLSLEGATIVSIPRGLAARRKEPGDVERDPAAALLVVQHFEAHLPFPLRGLARLGAGLAAAAPERASPVRRRRSLLRRLRRARGLA
jgi:glycosyltransferase involved in cell wall biosynthesis